MSADAAAQAAPVFSQHFGMSSHLYSSPYIGQADDSGNLVSNSMMPGSIAQNSVYSAAQVSAAQRSGHVIGEADITAVSSMGSNAAVSQHLGISLVGMSQVGISGPYGNVGSMAGTMGYSAGQYTMAGGQFTGGYHPGSSSKMAMPGEIMGTVTLPIYNVSPYPVPVTGSSQHGQQQQYHHHIQVHSCHFRFAFYVSPGISLSAAMLLSLCKLDMLLGWAAARRLQHAHPAVAAGLRTPCHG